MLTIPNIKVTSGKCEIGFLSEGDATTFLMVDDVAFYESTGLCGESGATIEIRREL